MRTMDLLAETRALADQLDAMRLPSGCTHAYDPLTYMRAAHARWLLRFTTPILDIDAADAAGMQRGYIMARRPYLILGMNPGPWGMVQTGVPFGDVQHARTILGFRAPPEHRDTMPTPTLPPEKQHPDRPVIGFGCTRREASGERLWGGLSRIWDETISKDDLRQELAGHPGDLAERLSLERVLADCFAMNYCPLAWFDLAGVNVTPEMFVPATRGKKPNPYHDPAFVAQLDAVCTPYLVRVMKAMQTRVVLAIGRYAERKANVAAAILPSAERPRVVYITHPSPQATRSADEWRDAARAAMSDAGVLPVKGAT